MNLDSVKYQQDDAGAELRKVLRAHTGWNTLPQVFIGGEFLGGCTDLFDTMKNGSLEARLNTVNLSVAGKAGFDPYTLLPGWLHPRGQ